MAAPVPALAPVIPPVIVPIAHAKFEDKLDVNATFGLVPLHILAVEVFVTEGAGFTFIVIVKLTPTQLPAIEVGVTIYCTLPAVVRLEFVNI